MLILGTLHGQAEAMRLLRSSGWTVHSCGHVRSGPGVHDADYFHLVDILDIDAVTALAQRIAVDVVYSVGSDIAMPTVAAVSERLGLPLFHSSAIVETLHRKANLRVFLNEHRLSVVPFSIVRSESDLSGFDAYPAIVKPSDSQGQRGITIVHDPRAAAAALGDAIAASHTSTAVIEKLLEGPEVSVHVFVVDGSVRFILPSDRIVWDGPAVGIPAAHAIPSSFLDGDDDVLAVEELITATVKALEIGTGPLYFQLKVTEDGPRIIEIAPRLDGCHLWRLVEFGTGFNILQRCFDLLRGERWTETSAEVSNPVRLDFLLDAPHVEFDPTAWPTPSTGLLFEELQVVQGELPRTINPAVARFGYRIMETS